MQKRYPLWTALLLWAVVFLLVVKPVRGWFDLPVNYLQAAICYVNDVDVSPRYIITTGSSGGDYVTAAEAGTVSPSVTTRVRVKAESAAITQAYLQYKDVTSSWGGGNLTFLDADDQGNDYSGVWGDGTFVYAACMEGGLRSYSVDGGGNLTFLDADYQSGYYYRVWGDGTFVYAACGAGGLRSYSVDGGGNLTYIDTEDQGEIYYSVWGDGTFVYAACGFGGLRSYSVDGGGNLTYIDTEDRGDEYSGVWGDGTFVYAACRDGGLRSYSVDGGGNLTYIDTEGQGDEYSGVWGDEYLGVWGDGTFVYAACRDGGLRSYSVDGGGNLTYIDTEDQGDIYYSVGGDGTFVYAACVEGGLRSYSVDGGGNLTYIDTDAQGNYYYDVWGDGTFVYAACGDGGLRSYSVSTSGGGGDGTWRNVDFKLRNSALAGWVYSETIAPDYWQTSLGVEKLGLSHVPAGNATLLRLYVSDGLYESLDTGADSDAEGSNGNGTDWQVVSMTFHATNQKPGRATFCGPETVAAGANNTLNSYNGYLVAYWSMDEVSGNRTDSSGNAHTLMDNNTVPSRSGKHGNASEFQDTVDEYLIAADHVDLSPTVSMAVSAWVYLDTDAKSWWLFGAYTRFSLYWDTAQFVFQIRQTDLTYKTATYTKASPAGSWLHVVGIADGSACRVYVSGVEGGTVAAYGGTIRDDALDIQIGSLGLLPIDGAVDEVALWNGITFADAAARQAFVDALYNSGSGRFWNGSAWVTP